LLLSTPMAHLCENSGRLEAVVLRTVSKGFGHCPGPTGLAGGADGPRES